MFVDKTRPETAQLVLMPLAEKRAPSSGEVFTRRWVVELILDLVGYRPERDLAASVLVEPSCGNGAFLLPVVDRLIDSVARHRRSLSELRGSIRAFDVSEANVERARKAVAARLSEAGLAPEEARDVATSWVTCCDFLLVALEERSADYIVGNPPYVRLEDVPPPVMEAYRSVCSTMRGRSDIYVGFFERSLGLLKPGGVLSFICADRWMRNQYGADLRALITGSYAVDSVISMHDVDAFEEPVSAYPAVITLRNGPQASAVVVDAGATFGPAAATDLATWLRTARPTRRTTRSYDADRSEAWFAGRELWPSVAPRHLSLLADLAAHHPPLQDESTGTRVGIGVATGCDGIFITHDPDLVEPDRLLPMVTPADIRGGQVRWSGAHLVDPWDEHGLVDLTRFPRLAAYFRRSAGRLQARHVAQQRPAQWYRTIDRVDHELVRRPRILLPDMKAAAHPVLDDGPHYPHHNLYYVVSRDWDPEVLGGLLLSDVTNLIVGAYCVRMRGGCYRFQAQYLRQIRLPTLGSVDRAAARQLRKAFADRDRELATGVAARLYGIAVADLPSRWADQAHSMSGLVTLN